MESSGDQTAACGTSVTGGILGWLSTSMGPGVVSLMNEGCQESTENSDIPKAVAEILTTTKVGKKK